MQEQNEHDEQAAASELDRLIAARREGPADNDAPARQGLDELSDVAASLSASWDGAAEPAGEAIWARVSAGIDATPQRRGLLGRLGWPGIPRLPSFATRLPVRASSFAAAAVAVAVIIAFALVSPRSSTSAAFMADLEALSAFTSSATADERLSDDEISEVSALAAALLKALNEDPEAVASLDAAQAESVAATLSRVMAILAPLSGDGERSAAATEGAEPDATPAAEATSQPAGADETPTPVPTPTPTVVAAAPAVTSTPEPQPSATPAATATPTAAPAAVSTPAPTPTPAPRPAEPVASVQAVVTAFEQQRAAAALLALCGQADGEGRAECTSTVQSAIAACAGVTGERALEACEDAVDDAEEVCKDTLGRSAEKECKDELRTLKKTAEDALKALERDHDHDDNSEDDKRSKGKGKDHEERDGDDD